MKKKLVYICALLLALLPVGMTGCSDEKEQVPEREQVQENIQEEEQKQQQVLSGSYTSQSLLNQMNYTFDKENNVTIRFFAGGYSVYDQTGIYEINEDGSVITFTFPTDEGDAESYLPGGMTSLSGAFSFRQEEDFIWIGTVCCQKDTVGSNQEETVQPDTETPSSDVSSVGEEPVALDQIHLTLPETYSLSYEVTEESSGISRTYTQTMTCTDTGIYLDLGDSGEKYVFEKLDSGKFIEYRCNALTGKYETPMISAAVQEQINAGNMTVDMAAVDSNVVDGYTARVDTYFDFYEEFRGYLTYQGQETAEGINCQKYTADFTTVSGEQAVELWIDPQTGLCIKGIYQYKSAFGVTGTKTILCTNMETEQAALPDYR